MSISVVVPVYEGENLLDELTSRLEDSFSKIKVDYRLILVDDGSSDNSWLKIVEKSKGDSRIMGLRLSKNFGQHNAITAGIDYCTSDWVVVMDCDLQDPPEYISQLYERALEGFDFVLARRVNRKHKFLKRFYSNFFYKVFSLFTGIRFDGTVGNFGIYSKQVYSAISRMREPVRTFPLMVAWIGFRSDKIDVPHGKRFSGKSTYSFWKLIGLAIRIIVSYSNKPLNWTVQLGLFISGLAILFGGYNVYAYFDGTIQVVGYASIIVSIWFLSGLIIFSLGILGTYLSKTFDAVKNRPIYLISDQTNLPQKKTDVFT